MIGADGRNSTVRKDLGFKVNADEPRNLLGGMLVKGVPSWPRDMQVIGVEGRFHFLIFPQGDDLLRLYGSYHFADKSRFDGPDRRAKLLDVFGKLICLPYAEAIAASTPIGPFNSFSNEDHWIDDPTCPGVVLIGDAAGHNDPILGQGLSIALRDVRLVSEILSEAKAAGRELRLQALCGGARRANATASHYRPGRDYTPRRVRSGSARATRASGKACGGGAAWTASGEPDRSGTPTSGGFLTRDDRETAGILTFEPFCDSALIIGRSA